MKVPPSSLSLCLSLPSIQRDPPKKRYRALYVRIPSRIQRKAHKSATELFVNSHIQRKAHKSATEFIEALRHEAGNQLVRQPPHCLYALLGCSAARQREMSPGNFSTTPSPNMYVPSPTGGVLFLGFCTASGRGRERERDQFRGVTKMTGGGKGNHLRGVTKKVQKTERREEEQEIFLGRPISDGGWVESATLCGFLFFFFVCWGKGGDTRNPLEQ